MTPAPLFQPCAGAVRVDAEEAAISDIHRSAGGSDITICRPRCSRRFSSGDSGAPPSAMMQPQIRLVRKSMSSSDRLSAFNGARPVGDLSSRYVPPSAWTRIFRPRSLSHSTTVAPSRSACATMKPMNVVLPEPVRPQTNVLPTSPTWK